MTLDQIYKGAIDLSESIDALGNGAYFSINSNLVVAVVQANTSHYDRFIVMCMDGVNFIVDEAFATKMAKTLEARHVKTE